MILNPSVLNESIDYYHLKMDSLDTAVDHVTKDCFMTSIDFKDAYYTIPIAKEHRKYLKSIWSDKILQFKALPNGLTSGPRLLPKYLNLPLLS